MYGPNNERRRCETIVEGGYRVQREDGKECKEHKAYDLHAAHAGDAMAVFQQKGECECHRKILEQSDKEDSERLRPGHLSKVEQRSDKQRVKEGLVVGKCGGCDSAFKLLSAHREGA